MLRPELCQVIIYTLAVRIIAITHVLLHGSFLSVCAHENYDVFLWKRSVYGVKILQPTCKVCCNFTLDQ